MMNVNEYRISELTVKLEREIRLNKELRKTITRLESRIKTMKLEIDAGIQAANTARSGDRILDALVELAKATARE